MSFVYPGEAYSRRHTDERSSTSSEDSSASSIDIRRGSQAEGYVSEQVRAELKVHQGNLEDAIRARRFKDAAAFHKAIINVLKDISTDREFSAAAHLIANLRQAVILLMCDDVDTSDQSLFPDMEDLSNQGGSVEGDNILARSLLYAKVGFLYMRSTNKDDLGKAKEYLDRSLKGLSRISPPPIGHLFPIAQCLADLFDLTGDTTAAEAMVGWLVQKTSHEAFRSIAVGRVSNAVDWCRTNGFRFKDGRFDVSAMEHAIEQNDSKHLEVMLIFTERTRPSSTLVSRLLLTAAETRNMTMSQLLFDHKASVDAVDEEGKTVLHRCTFCRDSIKEHGSKKDGPKMAGFFLSKNAGLLDKQDLSGKTALYMACEAGYAEMVLFLLGINANANLTENNGQSPLYMACERGNRQIVKYLAEKATGLHINAKGPGGQTPLIAAVQYAASHAEGRIIVELLLKKGADPSIEDNTGKTAASYVGGIWASDLKSALKSARSRTIAGPSTSSLSLPQKASRPPSVRTSMLAKIMQPRTKSNASSLFSPSRTSLDTASDRPASIFSNDFSSRRTSITLASNPGFDEAAEWMMDETIGASAPVRESTAQKGKRPSLFSMKRRGTSDDEHRSPRDAGEDLDPTSPLTGATARDVGRQDVNHGVEALNDQTPTAPTDRPHPPRYPQDTEDSVDSDQSSTDYEYGTPSDSEEASCDGDISPFDQRMHSLPVRSHPGGIQERPGQRQGQQNSSFDGASSMPTPPSEHPRGTGSSKGKKPSGSSGASRGGKTREAVQDTDAGQKRQVLLACPFAKKDPITYEHCHTYELKEIKHVKQHLKRCHLIVVCARCMEGFPNQDTFDRHIRAGVCEISHRGPPEGMTIKQHEILKPRTNHKLSLEEQWYFIWDTLFPGRERPATPYKDEFVNMTEFHKLFRDFRDNQIPSLAAGLLGEMGSTSTISHEQAMFMMRRGMLEFASMLQRAGVVGQTDDLSNRAGSSRSVSVGEAAEASPSRRLNSLETSSEQDTPDSNGSMMQSNSPRSTRLSNDDCYLSLPPIEEASTVSPSQRQDSVGVPQEADQTMNQPQQNSPPLTTPYEVQFQQPGWNHPYNMQTRDPAYGNQVGVGPGWNDTMDFDPSTNPLYAANNLFNVDHNTVEQMFGSNLNFDINMDLDIANSHAGHQPHMNTHDFLPAQPPIHVQQTPPFRFMSAGQQQGPYPPQSQNGQEHVFSPSTQQANNGQAPPWTMN